MATPAGAAAPERVDARVAACERAARILALAGSRPIAQITGFCVKR